MATQTASSDHPSIPEPVEKGMGVEVKEVESKAKDEKEIERSEIPKEEPAKQTIAENIEEQAESIIEPVEKEKAEEEDLLAKEPKIAVVEDAETSEPEHKKEDILANNVEAEKESVVAEPKEDVTKDVECRPAEEAEKTLTDAKDEELAKTIDNVEEVENAAKEVKTEEEEEKNMELLELEKPKNEYETEKIEELTQPEKNVEREKKEKIEEEKAEETEESTQLERIVQTEKKEELVEPEAIVIIEGKIESPEELSQPENNVQTGEEKGEKTEKLTYPTSVKVAEATSLAEKDVGGENKFRDIEMVKENSSDVNEIVEKPHKPETEAKVEENAPPINSEVENEKEEVAVKTKQSSNILTKVKQSLVKAKKAILGKSQNSKAQSNDTEGDLNPK